MTKLHYAPEARYFRPDAPNRVLYVGSFSWMHIGAPDLHWNGDWGVSCLDIVSDGFWSDGTRLAPSLSEYIELFTEGCDRQDRLVSYNELPQIAPDPAGIGRALIVAVLWARRSVDAIEWASKYARAFGFQVEVLVTCDFRDWSVAEDHWWDLNRRIPKSIERHLVKSRPPKGYGDDGLLQATWNANQHLAELMLK